MSNCNCPCPCPPCPPTPPEEIGYIRCRSHTGSNSLPVPNVEVNVFRSDIVRSADNASFTTGPEALSDLIPVKCPSRAYSLDPDNTTVLPYSVYELVANVSGFGRLRITGVQVFAGEVSMVDLSMLPLEGEESALGDDTFNVPEHSLFAGDGGSGRPPIETAPLPRVLPEVIIPSKITVHLGKPSSTSARNVTVSFRDYIKNVASSEVYPTWPEQALRANIHAQISLALNRVYTEWYPSKGYNFNITNSTSYDQAYVPGRDIFEIMSRLTDDIFNTYVRKPGTVEPYFTEYCDGKQVTCKGMKQWGTVDQANTGKNALQILRVYYPNVDVIRTNNIQAIPESYPGTPLREGSTGASVRTIQRQLNRIAKDYPFFGTVTVDGVFGASTTAIVKKFQKQFSLTQDGIVGRSTWYKISYIYVAVKKLAELTSEGEKPNGDLVAGQYPGTPLRLGSRGDSVAEIQFWLNQVGQFVTTIPVLAEDGIFGAGTEQAVRAFQRHFGLSVDGIVGPSTWNSIYAEYKSIEVDTTPPEVNRPGQYPGTPLRLGDTGESVRRLQFYLRIIARSNTAIPSLTTDGIYGTGTRATVITFQTFYGLAADGVTGLLTWNKVYEVYTDLINGLLAPSQRPGTYPGTPLRQGDSGINVKEMQYYLYLLSAYFSTIPQIAYDGRFGPATTTAVRAFQTLAGLTVDGIVGRATWDALYARFQTLRNIDGPTYAFNPNPYPGRPIGIGSGGQEVYFIQYLLLYIGFFYDTVLPVAFTGSYTQNTADGVASFQELSQLPITGEVDQTTWDSLVFTWFSLAAVSGEPVTGNVNDYPGFVLQLGSAGVSVRQLQIFMNGIAERFSVVNFVPEDGIFGPVTEAAVREFQQGFGLPINGIVDRATWDAIYNYYSLPE